jgi:DeoR/GlpR family transcriptional regulator of sugar metabolism
MPPNEGNFLAIERQRIIEDLLEHQGAVRTIELKEILNVSVATVRADLRELESAGVCEVIWGGAVSKRRTSQGAEQFLLERSKLNAEAKRAIGARAAQLVEVGQTIFVDAGTTTVEFVEHLPTDWEYLRLVTPSLSVAAAAAQFAYVELVMAGGVLRHLTRTLVGAQTVRALEGFNADWAFLASGGFSLAQGATNSNTQEVEVKRTMVKQAARVALLVDSSKFGKTQPLTVAPLSAIDVVITDSQLSDANCEALMALGPEVIRVHIDV